MRIWDIQELAAIACGLTEDQYSELLNSGKADEMLDEMLNSKFGMDLEQFSNVAEALLKFTPVLQSPLSGDLHHVFGVSEGSSGFRAILKAKAKPS